MDDEVELRWTWVASRNEWSGHAVDSGEVLIVISAERAWAMTREGQALPKTARRSRGPDGLA